MSLVLALFLLIIPLIFSSSDSSSSISRSFRKKRSRDPFLGNGNNFHFGDTVNSACGGYLDIWENPSIPYGERNNIGRAKWQSEKKVKQAKRLIKLGKFYNLGYNYFNNMPIAPGRFFNKSIDCQTCPTFGGCQTPVNTNAIGNVGTQFDGLGHVYAVENGNPIFHNNFLGSDVLTPKGLLYIGIENMPHIFTRALLLDIPRYLKLDKLPFNYTITTEDILGTLARQNVRVTDLSKGDVVLIYTGYSELRWPTAEYMSSVGPGLTVDAVKDVFYKRGVMIIGSDSFSVETPTLVVEMHLFWIECSGGFLHEGMKLDEWVTDARSGKVPYIGAYVFDLLPIEGGCCSPGNAVVYV